MKKKEKGDDLQRDSRTGKAKDIYYELMFSIQLEDMGGRYFFLIKSSKWITDLVDLFTHVRSALQETEENVGLKSIVLSKESAIGQLWFLQLNKEYVLEPEHSACILNKETYSVYMKRKGEITFIPEDEDWPFC